METLFVIFVVFPAVITIGFGLLVIYALVKFVVWSGKH